MTANKLIAPRNVSIKRMVLDPTTLLYFNKRWLFSVSDLRRDSFIRTAKRLLIRLHLKEKYAVSTVCVTVCTVKMNPHGEARNDSSALDCVSAS